jgi:hypothetical protein
MPNIGLWYKSRKDDTTWKYADLDIYARIDGGRGGWEGRIIDKEFNGKYDYETSSSKYTEVRDKLIKRMKDVHGDLRKPRTRRL